MKNIETTLRSMDPAATTELAPDQRIRADATLHRILADPPGTGPTSASTTRPRRSRRLALAAAGTLLLGAVSWTAAPQMAYASWTSVPSATSQKDLRRAEAVCRQELPRQWRQILSEQRGNIVMVGYVHTDPRARLFAECRVRVKWLAWDYYLDGYSIGGGFAVDQPYEPVDARTVSTVRSTVADGSADIVTRLLVPQLSSVAGVAGSSVRSVTVISGPRTVTATLQNGWFYAWWPGTVSGPVVVKATLTDGTVVQAERG